MTSPIQGEIEDEHGFTEHGDETDLDANFLASTSWTVSSSKPGCGVTALRSPDTTQFWQSDGPQPHYLTIHFFKLVSIVHMRIFLDFENDESYTPTKMQFWAGMGIHDLQEFAEMTFEQPKGWIDVDFSKVGPLPDASMDGTDGDIDWVSQPILRAFLLQVRIVENHQNGKDTHLRGLQIFSVDPTATQGKTTQSVSTRSMQAVKPKKSKSNPIRKASWMLEPELR
ncbi:hypothetical protein ANO11243_087570 [Dothideomycetidae sp. 11243]|nr:hypothetical protein ANO11243_087570 [fungal sp. No.11243]